MDLIKRTVGGFMAKMEAKSAQVEYTPQNTLIAVFSGTVRRYPVETA